MSDKRVCRICGKELPDESETDVCSECGALLNKLDAPDPDETDERIVRDPIRRSIEEAAKEVMSKDSDDSEDENTDETNEESADDPISKNSWLWFVIPLASVLIVFAAFFIVHNRNGKDSDKDSSSEDSSQAVTTTTTTADASSEEEPSSYTSEFTETPTEPKDGNPGGRYIFSQVFDNGKEVFLSVDIDPESMYLHFNGDGTGVYNSPNGAVQIAWKDGKLSADNGLKADYSLDGNTLTVIDGTTKMIYIHESAYEKNEEKPDGKYVYFEGYSEGKKLDDDGSVNAENTYLIFNSDGTGTATNSSGSINFTWENGHITYADKSDATYILRGDKLTLYEITTTVVMVKADE